MKFRKMKFSYLLNYFLATFRKLIFPLLLFPLGCFAQITITGKVVSRLDSKPLTNATVFLNNATVGAETAADGTFTLHGIKPGKYEMVVSVIGFETFHKTITVENSDITLPVIGLLSKTIVLNEVAIKSQTTDPNRERDYQWFKDAFLGRSALANDCKILNPEVVNLAYNRKASTLTASSEEFIKIENNALGYHIKYLLSGFSDQNKTIDSEKIAFSGSVLFEEMKGSATMEKRWQRNRMQVYEGSPMHFLRSALNNTFNDEGFQVFCMATIVNPQRPIDSLITDRIKFYQDRKNENSLHKDSLTYWQKKLKLPKTLKTYKQLNQSDFIKLTDIKGLYALSGNNGTLFILFNKKRHAANFNPDDLNSNRETTVYFNSPYALFDKNGVFTDPNSLTFKGAWAIDRVPQLLPVDYEPFKNAGDEPSGFASKVINAENVSTANGPLKSELLKFDSVSRSMPREKFYLQLDKPYYALGDTIWFKAYLLNALLTPSTKSGIMYIDIATDNDKVVKQYRFPVRSGLAWGNISIDEKIFGQGHYTLRAYTNWTRNFGGDAFCYKDLIITAVSNKQLLVSATFTSGANDLLASHLQLNTPDKLPFSARPVIVKVLNNGKSLFDQKMTAGVDGALDVKASLPPKMITPVIIIENEKKEQLTAIPVILNRPENTDVQFLPEGGSMVAGLPARIGIKATGEDGHGVDISGTIITKAGVKVASFSTIHNGMGSVSLDVQPGEKYMAKVQLPGGAAKEFALPEVSDAGTVLHVKNEQASDSLEVTLGINGPAIKSGESCFLLGTARGLVCYATVISLKPGSLLKRRIAKSLFPEGVVRFTTMTTQFRPLNERQVFIDHDDNFDIRIAKNRPAYVPRDSVGLKLNITDSSNNPVSCNFSVSVTDDAQVKAEGREDENIMSRMLLTTDLKGFVESPGYYLAKTPQAWQALDNLLLTQGWTGFDWSNVNNPPKLNFQPEDSFKVTGVVTNVLNKPVRSSNIMLFSTKPSILMDTTSNVDGRFTFDHFPRVDTPVFILKAVNKNGKSFNINIKPDEITFPIFEKPIKALTQPWYVNSDNIVLNYAKNAVERQALQGFEGRGHLLKQVNITAKKIIKGSQNLNGSGNADFVVDERDLEAAGKKNWLQLLQENLKGFREGVFKSPPSIDALRDEYLSAYVTDFNISPEWYFINDKPIKFIVDGVSVTQGFNSDKHVYNAAFYDLKSFLTSHSAEDIKGIEVINSAKYASSYLSRYEPSYSYGPIISNALSRNISIGPSDIAFIEITTRSGNGPIIDNTPGMYVYKPLPLSWPKAFYKPKYTVKDTMNMLDLRSTINWEPNITTDTNGEANIWFYTADKPSTYTVTIEGTDMNGHFGFVQCKIKVEARKEKTK
ncbi:MAG TPA: carboxypeptidase-like regulatory domain-containing protein [Mucilaginibacter sp.]|nr:carboxypeptidase-like regulatory domain-containing protein [Mucilaginibacter sp.]